MIIDVSQCHANKDTILRYKEHNYIDTQWCKPSTYDCTIIISYLTSGFPMESIRTISKVATPPAASCNWSGTG